MMPTIPFFSTVYNTKLSYSSIYILLGYWWRVQIGLKREYEDRERPVIHDWILQLMAMTALPTSLCRRRGTGDYNTRQRPDVQPLTPSSESLDSFPPYLGVWRVLTRTVDALRPQRSEDDQCRRRLAHQPQHPLWNATPVSPSLPPLVAEVPVPGAE